MEVIKEVSVAVTGLIRSYDDEDHGILYDWVSDNDDSDEWFDTAEDAERGFMDHFGN